MINNLNHNYIKIDYKNILDAYSHGIFPMAENIDSLDVFWVCLLYTSDAADE